jgi:hypothetical protein
MCRPLGGWSAFGIDQIRAKRLLTYATVSFVFVGAIQAQTATDGDTLKAQRQAQRANGS